MAYLNLIVRLRITGASLLRRTLPIWFHGVR